jgi:murein DD-endopeptidase MepM/ murein hydrolase activator NlpD
MLVLAVASPATAQETPGLSDARERAADAAEQVHEIEEALGELDGEISRLQAEQAAAQAELEDLRMKVRHLALERYMENDPGTMVPTGEDLNAQGRAHALAEIVSQTDRDAIDQYRAVKDKLERSTAELEAKQQEQQGQLDEMNEQRDRLSAELDRLEALEAQRIEAERRAAEARAAADAASKKQAQDLKALQDAMAAGKAAASRGGSSGPPTASGPTPGPIASGDWICPVQGARTFRDSWGDPRSGGRSHKGVDIMSPRGTPVVTPVSGTVRLQGDRLGGLSFHLQGDDGNYYYGTHLDSYAGPSGRLPGGTVVGYVGDTGNAVGTHLHFEIHIGSYGNPINPYPTVAQYC